MPEEVYIDPRKIPDRVYNLGCGILERVHIKKETGSLEKKELHRNFRKIDPNKLKTYVSEHPDAYQSEMAEAFSCSESGIRYALWRYKITRKKDHSVSRARPAKSKGIFRTNQRYPIRKDCLRG